MRLLGQSFQAKLMLALSLPLLLIWISVLLTSAAMLERQQKFVGDQQESTTKLQADQLNDDIQQRLAILEAIASGLDAARLGEARYATDILMQRPALQPLFSAGAVIYDRSGTALGDYPVVEGRQGRNYAEREYLQRLYATGKPTISQPYVGHVLRVMLISMCVPVTGEDRQIRGALCGNLDMQATNFLGRLSAPQSMGDNGFFLIRTSDRVLIASTDSSRVMSQLPDNPLVRQLMEGSGRAFMARNVAGVEKLYSSSPVAVAGWALALGLPTDIAYAPVRATVGELKNEASLASLLVILAAFFLARRLLKPLQQAGRQLDAMSSGREPLQRVDETGDTEVRSLLTSFNRLSDSLASQQTQLQSERNALLQAKAELSQLNMELEARVVARTAEVHGLNAFLKEVVEHLPLGLVLYDQTGCVLLRNDMLTVMLNLPPELAGKANLHLADVVRHNHDLGADQGIAAQEMLAKFLDAMARRLALDFEILLSNGVSYDVRALPVMNGWTLVTYNDTTHHKLAERAILEGKALADTATKAKSDFIANISHEIRTPMNAILGLSYLLQQAALPEDAQHMVGKIRGAGRLLMGILDDVLDFSKIESGKLEVQVAPFHLDDVLNSVATIMASNAQDKELELVIAAAPPGASQLLGDSLRLEQVLINLTGNAIKFTEQGHVTVDIRKVQEDAETLTLRFAVRDSGIGIAQEKQQLVFAEFSQADGSTSRKYGGSGLGLAISRRLVAAMGGELEVTSVPAEGSEFWFSLCFRRMPDIWQAAPELAELADQQALIAEDSAMAREALRARQGGASPVAQTHTPRLQGLRMLVVDDSDINREVAQRIFVGEGAQVSLAGDGQEALDWLAVHPGAVDMVLMDVQMPVMNGYEATRRMRHIPALKDLPVVALTAGAFMEQQELARQAGMSGFIAKPFDVDKAVALIMKLTRHLGLAAVPRAAPLNLPSPGAAENLPGIAVAKALATWHDAARYQKFLHLFAQRYADIVPALRGATIADAQALAHKFRGAAGNLGLDDVAGAALALEQLIKSNESPEPALLGLQAAMAVALDSIARYAAPVEPAPVQGDAMHNPLAQQLPGLLTAWQSDSSSEVARVLETMRQSLPAHSRELLQTALDNYDFRAGEAATMGLMPARPELKEET